MCDLCDQQKTTQSKPKYKAGDVVQMKSVEELSKIYPHMLSTPSFINACGDGRFRIQYTNYTISNPYKLMTLNNEDTIWTCSDSDIKCLISSGPEPVEVPDGFIAETEPELSKQSVFVLELNKKYIGSDGNQYSVVCGHDRHFVVEDHGAPGTYGFYKENGQPIFGANIWPRLIKECVRKKILKGYVNVFKSGIGGTVWQNEANALASKQGLLDYIETIEITREVDS